MIYQSSLTMFLVFLVVKLKEVLLSYRTAEDERKLPKSLIGVTVIGNNLIPPYMMDQMNFLAVGWS